MNKQEILEIISNRKVIFISGEYGRGKTLSGVALIFFISMLNDRTNILSNIPLYFKKFNSLYNILPLIDSSSFDNEHPKTIIFHDEGQRDFNSRDFMGSSAKIVSKFSVDLRKDDSQLIEMIQFIDRIDSSLAEIIQLIIIPKFINTYSHDEKKDNEIRLRKKDFWSKWEIIDKKYNDNYSFEINLYPFLEYYLTKFKPLPIVVNHQEYIYKQEKNLSNEKFERLLDKNKKQLSYNMENWNNGLMELKRCQ